MRLQAKSLISSLTQVMAPKARPVEVVRAGVNGGPVQLKTVANLQALASELRLFATEGTFEYPRNWVQIAGVAAVLLMGLAGSSLLALLLPVLQMVLQGVPLSQIIISPWIIGAVACGMVLALALAAVLLDLFPS